MAENCARPRAYRRRHSRDFPSACTQTQAGNGPRQARTALFRFKAYPFAELAKTGGEVRDRLGRAPITVRFDAEHGNATAEDAQGQPIPAVVGFWFAWYAFHPDTLVYKAKPR